MSLFAVLLLVEHAAAFNVFQSNCTLPETTIHFVSGPDTRGTLDILWTSLATIIACVYSVLHLNVPEQRQGRSPGWRGDLYWALKDLWTTLRYSLLTVCIPELMLGKALADLYTARKCLEEIRSTFSEEDAGNTPAGKESTWQLQHMLYAGMGGFVVVRLSGNEQSPNQDRVLRNNDALWYLDCRSLTRAIKGGLLPKRPPITTQQIADKSKADLTAKAVAIAQICYFVVSVIARGVNHLAISQLEIAACAFVPYAIAIYIASYHKPKAARTVEVIARLTEDVLRQKVDSSLGTSIFLRNGRDNYWTAGAFISNSNYEEQDGSITGMVAILLPVVLSIPFGAIHLAAWNFAFPSITDQWLWRIASIVVATSLPVGFTMAMAVAVHQRAEARGDERTMYIVASIFLVARLIIIVEMFRTLAFLEPSSYVSTWTTNIPHIG